MALSLFPLLFISCFLIPLFSNASLHFRSQLTTELDSLSNKNDTPTTYFEVTNPIKLPKTKPCSYLILKHDFGYTYGKPPVLANYTPPSNCPSQKFSKIVLEWKATSKGRQFDRIFGVWLGGVEIFRSCTAEPRPNGIVWTVKKDITRYHSLLMTNQTLAVYLGNIIDTTYTGVYHVKVYVHFYPADQEHRPSLDKSYHGFDSGADLIIPLSRNLPLNDGLWFEIENSTDVQSKEFKIPQNTYRAVLEVYVSFHENDEFWYGNVPNDYISANNRTDLPGNGAFREVVVSLDDVVVGAVWPFTVIYTGGINPLFWRPVTGISSFNLPSYDIEITPLLEKILDGSTHKISFSVTNALNVWYVDANLHLWLDKKSVKTQGKLLEYSYLPLDISLSSNFTGLDGNFIINARRSISFTGWVKSFYHTVITTSSQGLSFSNKMVLRNGANLQIVDQIIEFNDTRYAKTPSFSLYAFGSFKKFQLHLASEESNVSASNLTLISDEKRYERSLRRSSAISVQNLQKAQGYMLIKDHKIVSGLGSTQQTYKYDDRSGCYYRDISSRNYTVLHDNVSNSCSKSIW